MIVTLDHGQLRVDFRYDVRIVERLKTVPDATWDKAAKTWYVPIAQADRLMEAMPLACFDYAAIGAACDAEQQRGAVFAACLAAWGIALRVDADGVLVAEGASVSPLIQELVTVRAADLRRVLASERAFSGCYSKHRELVGGKETPGPVCLDTETQEAPENVLSGEVTEFDRLFFRGIQNAAKREQEQAARGRGRRPRRKAKPVQRDLFHA